MAFGVYVHIPFCAKRCDYCAFATWTDRHHLAEDYVAACRHELNTADIPQATSVFFGGGTPSLIDPNLLVGILDDIDRSSDAEVTVECNPETVTYELFETYARHGVNRISMGVQSVVPHVLEALGRIHNQANVVNAMKIAHDVGIDRVNVDLIYGAKGESIDDWKRTLEATLELNPKHVSAYGLTVEAGTPLAKDLSRHPDDDDQAEKYVMADDLFSQAGLENYEISNWATPGQECRHNVLYWQQGNYRGIGCSSHSHQDGRRWWNIRTPDRYIKSVNEGASIVADEEILDDATRKFEKLELQMRMRSGVPIGALDTDDLDGFVVTEGERVVLTRKGKLMANEIAMRLESS